jgi:hypothetical protein
MNENTTYEEIQAEAWLPDDDGKFNQLKHKFGESYEGKNVGARRSESLQVPHARENTLAAEFHWFPNMGTGQLHNNSDQKIAYLLYDPTAHRYLCPQQGLPALPEVNKVMTHLPDNVGISPLTLYIQSYDKIHGQSE